MSNTVEQRPLERRAIRETPIFGWKGAVVIAAWMAIFMPVTVYPDWQSISICMIGAMGWLGWGIQEWQHKKGYEIR